MRLATYILAAIVTVCIISALCNFIWTMLFGVANTYGCGFTTGIFSACLSNLWFEILKEK